MIMVLRWPKLMASLRFWTAVNHLKCPCCDTPVVLTDVLSATQCLAESWRRHRWQRLQLRNEHCSLTEWQLDLQHKIDHLDSLERKWTAQLVLLYTELWSLKELLRMAIASLLDWSLRNWRNCLIPGFLSCLWSVSLVLQEVLLGFYSMADQLY